MKILSINELAVVHAGFNTRCSSRLPIRFIPLMMPESLIFDSFILCRLQVWEVK
ncbi:hypothetical protein Runsl_2468 [Runella slithyformis DSM 19594]|uniref:Uncharacterized protein n=1 Tax=Runella slithyformis (strain ATCC 29530 / DSM 19594 / LMG 11500 / NCIMB 11436 / LSU 4) TaxID=761193 RepID=A0A7U4E5V5_RUNSL|nr:hypothetical protein Runsl_2468 [Runella slithyformis DSM 19594]